ncbi:folate-binding protein YgfZ [Acaryochloris sp. CCMEE 5410]|uniref:CAF17-like 4Fe-4S cluster assembly/insertion protein YgfZ n=1 Tax=Acaryochloris sp. CCMEE 5410 TaxID=310037 RepID=UPI0002483D5B|nr:folate-binding protein YgfZ [Acaryochloris sp. CCMEE 5410]KAI9131222.1 folate-binding protein YgfZ [Acaryochloris sp. CCMEE 5410]
MSETLQNCQRRKGAVWAEDQGSILSFGNDESALKAAQDGAALWDRTHWGRLQFTDQDRLSFLHNQTTNTFKTLKPGEGCESVFVTSTARTIDLVSAYVTEEAVVLLVSPTRRAQLMSWCDRYIFFGDKVKIADITAQTITFSLLGPESSRILHKLGISDLPESPHHHITTQIKGHTVRVASGSGLTTPGYTLFADTKVGAELWQALTEQGACPLGEKAWEQLRVTEGRPKPGAELTEDFNPLEAGLWQTISFDKGCYIGQETIARLNTYQGVKQRLWGIQLSESVSVDTPITLEDKKVGVLTSLVETAEGPVGLGYVKTKAGDAGAQVSVGTGIGTLVEVPFLTYPQWTPDPTP